MASEEVQCDNIDNQAQPPPPVPPLVSGGLPPYPEMILAAIEALNEDQGSNKSSISKQIEDTHGDLPPAHSTLLTHHLNKMKSSGQLIFSKNSYRKPDTNSPPPRRGRGRPPKPKTSLPSAAAVLSPPRPRGRPPKSRDPAAPPPPPKPTAASTSDALSGRKRGRPPKAAASAGLAAPPRAAAAGPPRGRGRPPKVKPAMAAAVGA
ncbi:PREDICTED: HMG-Y-related protein A-like [Erythranthe guttata]|uniref:HMG-Y-related protein A-like n=1 Tax=Erythranthe guttata TaxID=4155 RepID=UPI00064E0BA2|nr:PREDICTED: HMG-Y-related protein A-like [Erythranthe guttata]|eukprot:XP_012852344.1 PREDICTED: HMG-Y-related protein A-like [Erythranthe guttata]